MVNTLFNKVLGHNEQFVFYFYLKTNGTFLPTQYIIAIQLNEGNPCRGDGIEAARCSKKGSYVESTVT